MTTCAFFDLDGCLVDSRAAITQSMNLALASVGLPPQPPEALYRHIGPPLVQGFSAVLRDLEVTPSLVTQCVESYRRNYRTASLALTTVVNGIPQVLEALYGKGPLIVVTSKPTVFARPILETLDLAGYFDDVYGPDPAEHVESKIVTLGRALERSCSSVLDPHYTCMIGDRRHDIVAGQRWGTRTVGVTWGIGSHHELVQAGADVVVAEPGELTRILWHAE